MTKHLLSVVALAALMVLSSCNKPTSVASNSASASAAASTSVAPSASASASVSTSKAVPVESVTLDKTTATLKEGETVTLVATVLPANATNNTGVIWTTSDATIATVADGVVTAVKAGTATITASAGGKSGTCAVTVTEAINKVSDITAAGDYTVIGKVVAKDTKNIVVNDGTGVIDVYSTEAVEVGDYVKVKGTVAVFNGIFEFSNSFTITKVTDAPAVTEAPAIDLTKEIADGWGALTENTVAANKLYKWTSGAAKSGNFWMLNLPGSETKIEPSKIDTTAYTIAENKAYNVEAYFIGYETKNKYASIVVTKLEATTVAPTALEVTADSTNIAVKKTLQLSVSPTPFFASTAVTWKSSDEDATTIDAANKVTVDANGLVSAPAGAADGHEVIITATSSVDGCTVSGTITLTVVAKLVTVTASQSLISMGETATLTPGTNVTGATPTFTYTTDTAGAALVTIGTVGTDGKVVITGKAAGTATITVAAEGFTETTIDIKVLADIATVNGYADKDTFETKGIVLNVISTSKFIVADKIGSKVNIAFVYKTSHGVAVGDYVDIVGSFSAASGSYYDEYIPTTITKLLTTDGYVAPTITAANISASATAATADLFNGTNTAAKIVSVTKAEVTVSGTGTSATVKFAVDGFSKGYLGFADASTITSGFYDFVGFLYASSSTYADVAVYNDTLTAATRPAATAISLSSAGNLTVVRQGETLQLSASQTPFGAGDNITWISSDTADTSVVAANKVTVSASGLVSAPLTAVIDHEVTITATSAKTSTVTASMKLKVATAPSKLTMAFSDTNWPSTVETTATAHTIGGISLMTFGLKKDTSDIYMTKDAGYLYNSAAVAGTIVSIEVTMSSGSSAGAYLGIYTGTSALATRLTTNSITFEKSEVVVFAPTVANSTFFQISDTSATKNIRFTNIVVKYLAA
jgi:uncharacterized protein YjdB